MKKYSVFLWTMIIILAFTLWGAKHINTMDDEVLNQLMADYKELKDLPENYDSKLAESNGDVVNVHGKVYNAEKLDAFMKSFKKKEPAMVRITQYTIEGDAIIKDLIYDGKLILLKDDNTRDKFAGAANQRIIEYKVSDIIVSKSTDGTEYDVRLQNGEIMGIAWIKSK